MAGKNRLKNGLIRFLRPSKRKAMIFLLIIFLLFFYMPVIKCHEGVSTKPKFCKTYGICAVDEYHSLWRILSDYDQNEEMCPASEPGILLVSDLSFLFLMLAYVLTCFSDYYYERFRDI